MSLRIHANIEKLKQEYAHLFLIDAEQVPNLDGRLVPGPYLIWDITNEKVLVNLVNEE